MQHYQFNSSKIRQIATLISSLFLVTHFATAQYQQLIIGGGIAPLHKSGQSDFNTFQMPYDIYVQYQRGNFGLRADYNWKGGYKKENFSFTNSAIELSIVYSLKGLLQAIKINPYVRVGASKWATQFTTEGYPGITDYELKVEQDQGYALGTKFT